MLIRYGNFLFRWRNTLFPVLMLALFVAFRPGFPGVDRWVALAGLLIVFGGAALRWTVVGMEYIKRGGLQKKVYADTLVTGGMFSHCRNPLYVGNLMILLGTFIFHGSPWVIAIGTVYFVHAYIAIVAAEENFLRGKFGAQFDEYVASTPRWGIRLAGLGKTLEGYRFNWGRVVVKEYTTDATAALTVLAVVAWRVWSAGGSGVKDQMLMVGGAAVAVAVLTLLIRVMKKAGVLKEAEG